MQSVRIKKQRPTPFEIRRAPTSLKWQLVRGAGRPKDVVAFDEAVVTFFLESADLLGVPKSVAAVYGICFASPYPLSYSDISDRLGVSDGSISQGVRFLCEIGALKLAPPPPAEIVALTGRRPRGDFYAPDMELRKVVAHFLEHRLAKQLKTGEDGLKSLQEQVPVSGGPETTKELSKRLEHLKTWHDRASNLVPVARAVLKLT